MTGQGLKYVMASDGTDFKECDYAKSEAKACEGKGGQAIEEGRGGNCGHIIIGIEFPVIEVLAMSLEFKKEDLFSGVGVVSLDFGIRFELASNPSISP